MHTILQPRVVALAPKVGLEVFFDVGLEPGSGWCVRGEESEQRLEGEESPQHCFPQVGASAHGYNSGTAHSFEGARGHQSHRAAHGAWRACRCPPPRPHRRWGRRARASSCRCNGRRPDHSHAHRLCPAHGRAFPPHEAPVSPCHTRPPARKGRWQRGARSRRSPRVVRRENAHRSGCRQRIEAL